MIFPLWLWIIPGIASFVQWKTEDRFAERIRFQSSKLRSCKRPMMEIPALFTRTSTWPKRDSISLKRRWQSFEFPTSACTARHSAPSASTSFFTSSNRSVLRAQLITIRYPQEANFKATARPIPRDEPVTRTVSFIMNSYLRIKLCCFVTVQ